MKRFVTLVPFAVIACASPAPPAATPPTIPTARAVASAAQNAPPSVEPDPVRDESAVAALSEKAEAIFGAFGNGMPRATPDGKSVVFMSTRDKLPQLYVGDLNDPKSKARRLLETKDRIQSFELVPGTNTVIFASDHGADENSSFFAVELDGSKLRELTPGDTQNRDRALVAANGTVAFSARKKTDVATAIYVLDPKTSAPARKVYTDPGAGELIAVSPDATLGLFRRYQSLSEQVLVVIDLAKGTTGRTLYPASGAVAIHDAAFTADGKHCLVATDAGGAANAVLKVDVASGKEILRYDDQEAKTGRVSRIVASPRGKLFAVLVDAGNRGVVRMIDAGTMKPLKTAELPLGDGSLGGFSPDDTQLLVRWASPTSPGDLFAVAVATGKARKLRDESRTGLDGLSALDVAIENVPAFDGLKIPVNTYVPRGATGKLPVIVMVHGGPASSSTIGYSPLVRFYTAHGFAVVEPNIRGSTGFGRAYEQADDGPKRLDALKDLESVGLWTKTRPFADPTRLVVWGGSYGGYMVLMGMTRQTELWRAGVDLVGPSNWRSFMATTTGQIREILSKEFGSVDKDGPFLDSISPLRDIDKVKNPLFVFQGQNDPRVPRSESDQIVGSLRKRNVAVEYMVAPDEGHSLDHRHNQVAFVARTTAFLKKHLGLQ